jgi:hypothetical protein
MIDFTVWDELLHRYVDLEGRVDYHAWSSERSQALSQWLASLQELDLRDYPNPDERLALWLNLYNAIAINQVLESYPIPSIRPKILGIPNWLAFLLFFIRPVYSFVGKRYSLNQIEHGILRREFDEPRIHFALVCASIGCPLLRNGAYFPESVRTQLEDDASRFINNPDKVRYDSQTGTLYCSKIFKWYKSDLLKVAPSIPEYIRLYLKTDVPLDASTPISYLYYDWNLNEKESY